MELIDIPTGNDLDSKNIRRKIIYDFYQKWKRENPLMRRYNFSLKEFINVRHISIDESSIHASKRYFSTLAVLQLDSILTYAVRKKVTISKASVKNQRMFEKIIIMEYMCPGIGKIKLTVGVRKSTHEKVQYCITAMTVNEKSIPEDA